MSFVRLLTNKGITIACVRNGDRPCFLTVTAFFRNGDRPRFLTVTAFSDNEVSD